MTKSGIGVIGGTHYTDKHLCKPYLAGVAINDRNSSARVVDEAVAFASSTIEASSNQHNLEQTLTALEAEELLLGMAIIAKLCQHTF